MINRGLVRSTLAGLALSLTASCVGTPRAGDGFRAAYVSSRDALEAGDYATAARRYAQLVDQAGPMRTRIQLEYAHTLLRADKFADAASQANAVAAQERGAARSAARAVEGTALHELAQMATGATPERKTLMQRAETALAEALAGHPDLDPLGTLEARHARIRAALAEEG